MFTENDSAAAAAAIEIIMMGVVVAHLQHHYNTYIMYIYI